MSETLAEVERILRTLCNDAPDLLPETNLVTDLGLDSILQLNLVVELENCFSIALELEEKQEVITIADLVEWIDRERGRVDDDE
jgi:acyl carrier protein